DQLGSGINSVIPVGFWDWHYQDEVDINNIATAMTEDQTITVSIPDLQEYGDVTASDLRLVGWDAGNGKWINLSSLTPGATGLTKGSTLTGVIEGGTTITALAIGSISRVLPVTFSDFTVKTDGCKAKLQWKTSFEQNNSHFLVEHSTDGIRFSTIGQVSATGNSTTIQTYNYTDNTPAAGANYYRVTQIDFDGKQRSTPIVLVKIKCDASPVVKIYPNPASNTLYIQSSKTVMQVNVLNSGGQPVLKYAPSTHGSGIFDMNIQQLPAGIYMLQIINKDGTIDVSKLMKK
ncbi:MAG: T9SS type A sorting domain-containing protein, partial [Sphingobacteriales bacterium]|nr:T9SS type A sorting domain-containing protein [Sphingobacteriales bacterium]